MTRLVLLFWLLVVCLGVAGIYGVLGWVVRTQATTEANELAYMTPDEAVYLADSELIRKLSAEYR